MGLAHTLGILALVGGLTAPVFAHEGPTGGVALPAGADSGLQAAEQIVARYSDLSAFLAADPAVHTAYFDALQKYYGADKFPRPSFDAIMTQLRSMHGRVPGLGRRLWGTTDLGEGYRITTDPVQPTRFELNTGAWKRYVREWRSGLEERSLDLAALSQSERTARMRQILERTKKQGDRALREAEGLPRRQRERALAEAFQRIRSDPQYQTVRSYLILQRLNAEEVAEPLRNTDGDGILSAIEGLHARTGPEGAARVRWLDEVLQSRDIIEPLDSRLVQDVLADIPAVSRLRRDATLFSEVPNLAINWDFVPLPRRIHGIFAGIPLGECVGGACQLLDSLSAERWAVIALDHTQQVHTLEDGRFRGFLQYAPLRIKGPGGRAHIDASVDFESPALRREVRYRDRNNRVRTGRMFELWLPEAVRRRPRHWRRFVVTQMSRDINNAGVLDTVRGSDAFRFGVLTGTPSEYRHIDPMARMLPWLQRRDGAARSYGGSMITEVTSSAGRRGDTVIGLRTTQRSEGDPQAALASTDLRTRLQGLAALIKRGEQPTSAQIHETLAPGLQSRNGAIRAYAINIIDFEKASPETLDALAAFVRTAPHGEFQEICRRLTSSPQASSKELALALLDRIPHRAWLLAAAMDLNIRENAWISHALDSTTKSLPEHALSSSEARRILRGVHRSSGLLFYGEPLVRLIKSSTTFPVEAAQALQWLGAHDSDAESRNLALLTLIERAPDAPETLYAIRQALRRWRNPFYSKVLQYVTERGIHDVAIQRDLAEYLRETVDRYSANGEETGLRDVARAFAREKPTDLLVRRLLAATLDFPWAPTNGETQLALFEALSGSTSRDPIVEHALEQTVQRTRRLSDNSTATRAQQILDQMRAPPARTTASAGVGCIPKPVFYRGIIRRLLGSVKQ